MIVVDVNILMYLVLRGEHTELAAAVAERDPDWSAPRLWRSEMQNALTGYIRKELLTVHTAMYAFNEADAAVRSQIQVDELRVFELVASSDCTSYDCEYIAAAEASSVALVTNDRKLIRTFPKIAVSMRDFLVT
ncbi:MAG: type II toxin-antitoxin system VapC family toxin [Pyrinomonadaceae bacterium]|nr:type II toxin-antitoxin system VapC family toxin [Pyrinomonadaceae bacterium]